MRRAKRESPEGTAENGVAYTSLLYHVVFATKGRREAIPESLQSRLWSYVGGIAKKNGFELVAAGGIEDHVHLVFRLPATMPVAKAVQLIKAGSSKWIHDELGRKLFQWQESYGAFTIGISQLAGTKRYIAGQKEHHRRRDFAAEWKEILQRHGLEEFRK